MIDHLNGRANKDFCVIRAQSPQSRLPRPDQMFLLHLNSVAHGRFVASPAVVKSWFAKTPKNLRYLEGLVLFMSKLAL